MGRLDGKIAIISGAARGQGAAEARLFVAEGASVVIADVLDDLGEPLAAVLGAAARYAHLDVTDEADWAATVELATSEFGGLNVLVANAGISPPPKPIIDLTLDEYRRVIDVNQIGTFLGLRAAIPAILASGGGSIVTISSVGGMQGVPGMAPYTSSKFAVRGLTRVAALEYADQGIRVNTVAPGPIDTAMMQPGFWGDTDLRPLMAATSPMRRVGQPEEVAELVLFLASDASSYCNGAEFLIDGGYLAGPTAVPSDD